MTTYKYVILGGGTVAAHAARTLAEYDRVGPGDVLIVSEDDALPYFRPALSKDYLLGEDNTDDLIVESNNFYRENGIKVLTGTYVTRLDTVQNTLITANMEVIPFEKLLIATGSGVKTLDIPGADLDGVEYLRSLEDASTIRHKVNTDTEAVILGGGYIGMEVTSALRQLDVPVTMVFPEDNLMEARFMTPDISAFFEQYYADRGVRFVKGDLPARIVGANGHVKGVELESGQYIDCNLIIAGIGAEPRTQVFDSSRLNIDDGLVVNKYLETNVQNTYAAGDVANYHDVIFDKQRRTAHWDNARAQGEYVARRMLGETDDAFVYVPYFFSDVFDLSYEFWGETAPDDEVVYRGTINKDGFSAWWLRNGRVVGAFVMNRPDEEREAAQRWIRDRQPIAPDFIESNDRLLAYEPFI